MYLFLIDGTYLLISGIELMALIGELMARLLLAICGAIVIGYLRHDCHWFFVARLLLVLIICGMIVIL